VYEARGERERAAEHYRLYLEIAPRNAPYRVDAEAGLARVGR
jgi:hypothetical protein